MPDWKLATFELVVAQTSTHEALTGSRLPAIDVVIENPSSNTGTIYLRGDGDSVNGITLAPGQSRSLSDIRTTFRGNQPIDLAKLEAKVTVNPTTVVVQYMKHA